MLGDFALQVPNHHTVCLLYQAYHQFDGWNWRHRTVGPLLDTPIIFNFSLKFFLFILIFYLLMLLSLSFILSRSLSFIYSTHPTMSLPIPHCIVASSSASSAPRFPPPYLLSPQYLLWFLPLSPLLLLYLFLFQLCLSFILCFSSPSTSSSSSADPHLLSILFLPPLLSSSPPLLLFLLVWVIPTHSSVGWDLVFYSHLACHCLLWTQNNLVTWEIAYNLVKSNKWTMTFIYSCLTVPRHLGSVIHNLLFPNMLDRLYGLFLSFNIYWGPWNWTIQLSSYSLLIIHLIFFYPSYYLWYHCPCPISAFVDP